MADQKKGVFMEILEDISRHADIQLAMNMSRDRSGKPDYMKATMYMNGMGHDSPDDIYWMNRYIDRDADKRAHDPWQPRSPHSSDSTPAAPAYDWRNDCEDGSAYGLYPHNFSSKSLYDQALQDARSDWRKNCSLEMRLRLNPNDFETQKEYEDAYWKLRNRLCTTTNHSVTMQKAPEQEAEEDDDDSSVVIVWGSGNDTPDEDDLPEIKKENYPNTRRYHAAEWYAIYQNPKLRSQYDEARQIRAEFIIKNADSIIAANYLTVNGDFLYAQAVTDHFSIPVKFPKEDDVPLTRFHDMIRMLAEKDIFLSIKIWDWCLTQFFPYAQYLDHEPTELAEDILYDLYYFPQIFKSEFLALMQKNPEFRHRVTVCTRKFAANLVAAAVLKQLWDVAESIFRETLEMIADDGKKTIEMVDGLIWQTDDEDTVEISEFILQTLLPILSENKNLSVQDKIPQWEKKLKDRIDDIETSCPKYSYTRRNAWRCTVPDGSLYQLDPLDYDTEEEYMQALRFEQEVCRREKEEEERLQREEEQARKKEEEKRKLQEEWEKDPNVYGYALVRIPRSKFLLSYRTQAEEIKVGDSVIVPLGKDNKETKGTVMAVGQYARIAAPYPVEKTKFILRKVTENSP